MSDSERNTYHTTILPNKSPLESIEFIKLRLNESRAINSSLLQFLEEYSKVQENYAASLNKVLLKGTKLFDDEEKFDKQVETLGLFSPVWNSFIGEVNTELKLVDTKTKTLHLDVLTKLSHFEKKYKGNSENLNNLRKLSYRIETLTSNTNRTAQQQQELDHLSREWESRVPNFVNIVENYDFNRFILLKDVFLSLQSSNQESLPELTKQTERSLEFVLNFDPNDEIKRFADEAASKSIVFDQSDLKAGSGITTKSKDTGTKPDASPEKHSKHHSFMGRSSHHSSSQSKARQSSVASTATNATDNTLLNNGFTGAGASSSSRQPKEKTKLKSRVGSIFGRKKDRKSKKAGKVDAIAESPMASTNTSRSSLPLVSEGSEANGSAPAAAAAAAAAAEPQQVTSAAAADRRASAASDLYQPSASAGGAPPAAAATAPENGTSAAAGPGPMSVSSQPLTPSSPQKEPRTSESGEYFSAGAGTGAGAAHAPPPVPATRGTFNGAAAAPAAAVAPVAAAPAAAPHHASLPPPPVPRQRKDINSTLFTGLEPIPDGVASTDLSEPPVYHSHESSSSITPLAGQTTGSSYIQRQLTGSSLLARQNTGSLPASGFSHPDLVHPGLNSSIAEVVNATFKDNQFVKGSVISELALSYIVGAEVAKIPSAIKLEFAEAAALGKLLVNNQFMRQTADTEFEIFDVGQIHLKTVGSIKYTHPVQGAAVSVVPVWRFEPHQASVVISIKPTPEALASLPSEDATITLSNLIVSVAISGASAASAATRPTGSFNKEKNRITWVYRGPVVLGREREERIIARFSTDGVARESDHGVQVKYTVTDDDGAAYVTSPVHLHSKNVYSIDPFDSSSELKDDLEDDSWKVVPTVKTLIAGKYEGHA